MTDDLPTTAVLGAGTMARAVVLGLLERAGGTIGEVRTTNHSRAGAARWAGQAGVVATAVEDDPDANRTAVAGADLVLLGVEPHGVVALLREVSSAVAPDATVVSLAAGVGLSVLAAELPAGVAIVRTAANTPSLVGAGVTGLAATAGTDETVRARVEQLFTALGEVLWVAEDDLHIVAATSGSGPAYLYFVLEQFARAAAAQGLGADEADRLARATFLGAAELLRVSGAEPGDLRRQVTSRGGSTERAIAVLDAGRVDLLLAEAMAAAIVRTREMGAEAAAQD
ncbi:pyrroline-5-carboxylate reductase [uncultured Friedmanniella sp.]|uniref:pyrroline-5-carboxylate reductase n=1 Tax=uncultured Friedmanniella sp. TaxID=335381 RepID=UPI0035C97BEF